MPSSNVKLSVGGHLSAEVIAQTDPKFAKRIREGLTWTTMHWEVVERYPAIISLIIEAKNGGGTINRRKTTFEVLLQILETSIASSKDSTPDWEFVRRRISRTQPTCLPILPDLVSFVVSCSGGKQGIYLRELVDIWKNCGLVDLGESRKIPGKLWKALADSGSPQDLPMARFKNMFVLTSFVSETCVEDGICGFITTSDVNIFDTVNKSRLQRLLLCNSVLNHGFELIARCPDASAPSGVASAPLGQARCPTKGALRLMFAVRLVRFLLSETKNRQRDGENYKSAGAIGYDLLQGLRQIWPGMDEEELKADARFKGWVPDPREFRFKMASPSVTLRETFSDGRLKSIEDQLHQKGFKVGDHLKSKTSDDLWVIARVEGDALVVEDLTARKAVDKNTKTVQALMEKYMRPPPGYEATLLHADPSWKQLDPRTSKPGAAMLAKAGVLIALESAAQLHPDGEQAVQPMLNLKDAPAGVQAAANAKAGTIVLVPWTASITIEFPDSEAWKKPIQWEVELKGEHALRAFCTGAQKPKIAFASQIFYDKKEDKNEEVDAEVKKKEVNAEDKKEEEEEGEDKKVDKKKEAKKHGAVFWRVQGFTSKQKMADVFNMEPGHITVNLFGNVAQTSRNIKVKKFQGKPDFAASVVTPVIVLPVLVNKKDVIKGDELCFLKYETEKTPAEQKRLRNKDLLSGFFQAPGSASEPASKKKKTA